MSDYREDLKAYADGELTPDRREELQQELERSPELRAELESIQLITAAIRERVTQPEAVGLEQTLKALQRENRVPSFQRFAWAYALAASLLFVAFVLPILQGVSSSSQESEADAVASNASKPTAVMKTPNVDVEAPRAEAGAAADASSGSALKAKKQTDFRRPAAAPEFSQRSKAVQEPETPAVATEETEKVTEISLFTENLLLCAPFLLLLVVSLWWWGNRRVRR